MVHFLAFSLCSKSHNENRQNIPSSFAMPLFLDHGSDARGGRDVSDASLLGNLRLESFFCLYVVGTTES